MAEDEAPEEVRRVLREMRLLHFEAGAPGGSFPVVARHEGKIVGPDFYDGVPVAPGSWWFCTIEDKGTFYIAHPVREFDVADVLRAQPDLLPRLFPHLPLPEQAGGVPPPAPKPTATHLATASLAPEGFTPLPRAEAVQVNPDGLDLMGALDLLDGATACDLLVDRGKAALALRPAATATRAWPVRDGVLASREPARALGVGAAWARWSDRLGLLVVTRGL